MFRPFAILLLWGAAALAVHAQPLMRAYSTSERMLEGGSVDILVLDTPTCSYAVNLPRSFGTQVRVDTGSITFTSPSNVSVITMSWTTNYPRSLPSTNELQPEVEGKFPSASLLQPFHCVTGAGPGKGFDLVRVIAPGMILRLRDGYLSLPGGSVEFTLSCNGPDFDSENRVYLRLLNSFRLHSEPANNNP